MAKSTTAEFRQLMLELGFKGRTYSKLPHEQLALAPRAPKPPPPRTFSPALTRPPEVPAYKTFEQRYHEADAVATRDTNEADQLWAAIQSKPITKENLAEFRSLRTAQHRASTAHSKAGNAAREANRVAAAERHERYRLLHREAAQSIDRRMVEHHQAAQAARKAARVKPESEPAPKPRKPKTPKLAKPAPKPRKPKAKPKTPKPAKAPKPRKGRYSKPAAKPKPPPKAAKTKPAKAAPKPAPKAAKTPKPAPKPAPKPRARAARAAKPKTPKTKAEKPARAKRSRIDPEAVAEVVEHLERDPLAVPTPIGPAGYRPKECAADAPQWGPEYQSALEEATERAAIEAGDDDDLFRTLLRRYFAEHPHFPDWSKLERQCVADFRKRKPRAKRKTETATSETKRAVEELRREAGEEIRGTAEHLDRLTLGGRAAYWRRDYKRTGAKTSLQRARDLERQMRARKKKGAGVGTHRA